MNPMILCDGYKLSHHKMYPQGITRLFSNFTPRKSRIKGVDKMVWFGLQYYIKRYLQEGWQREFFDRPWNELEDEYKRFTKSYFGVEETCNHFKALHELGYLPIAIWSLPEGSRVNIGVPTMVMFNTHENFAWLVNFLETNLSNVVWSPSVTATIGHEYRRLFDRWAEKTGGDPNSVQFQGHDFAMRGYSSTETSQTSGAGHLLSFSGTDTIPAIMMLEKYYGADLDSELVGCSVPATEHSVMTSYGKENEIDAFKRLLELYPTGILSVVSDSFDLWAVCTKFLPELKDQILARNGKLVIRPDSGNPVDILCGCSTESLLQKDNKFYIKGEYKSYKDLSGAEVWGDYDLGKEVTYPEIKGVVELLWDVFGGTINEKGYKVLDPHIGCIYGDSITLERADEICKRLEAKGFCSTNWVAGIGSFTYQYNTRDTFGMAMKATYCEVDGKSREIFKDPITDNGEKKSAKGLLAVYGNQRDGFTLEQGVEWEDVFGCAFNPQFANGILVTETNLKEIRELLAN